MMAKNHKIQILVLGLILLLSSCNSRRSFEDAGLLKSNPDEFLVTTRPNLKLPKDFELPSPQEKKVAVDNSDGRELLVNKPQKSSQKSAKNAPLSKSEEKLLAKPIQKQGKDKKIETSSLKESQEEEEENTGGAEEMVPPSKEDRHEEIESKKIDHDAPPQRIRKQKDSQKAPKNNKIVLVKPKNINSSVVN
jgi:hypothetical protein